jgi:NDP-sugar pyrophosphorylase family protein|tara:strand:+ start:197 stop:631 length:435 start_codon:yes stop_codon:yes gene_type:complete
MLNIFGKSPWATKITSLLTPGDWAEYDESNYDSAPGRNKWIIAEEDGFNRETISSTYLDGVTYETLFKGLDDLEGVTYGDGLVVGPGSLIRPTTVIGNQVYIGAGTIIDIDCIIEDNATIGDNVTVTAGSLIKAGSIITSGSII